LGNHVIEKEIMEYLRKAMEDLNVSKEDKKLIEDLNRTWEEPEDEEDKNETFIKFNKKFIEGILNKYLVQMSAQLPSYSRLKMSRLWVVNLAVLCNLYLECSKYSLSFFPIKSYF
jgi:hypothetical protein